MGHSKGSPEREVHSYTGLPKKNRNISNKQPNPTSTRTGGTTTNRVNRRKEIIKIREELNDIETKEKKPKKQKTIQSINKSRSWFFEQINKIDKTLNRLIKKKRERTQINKIRYERGEIATDTTENK